MIVGGTVLNGQQLISLRLKESRDLPIIGQKEFQPTNSWLEKKQIQSALSDRKVLLEEQRVEKSNALSSAEWISDVKKAKVTKKVGKVWENFGHHADDADWLYPEEALLLLETNSLELLLNEVPLSIERGYITLLHEELGCTLNEYRVFSHLARLGYRIFRHLAEVSVTRYEKEIRLDQYVLRQKRTCNLKTVPRSQSGTDDTGIADKSNDFSDRIDDFISIEPDVLDVGCNVTTDRQEREKIIDNEIQLSRDKEKTTGNVIPIVEPEESGNSCDILSVASKEPTNKSDNILVQEDALLLCIDDDDDDDIVEIPIDKEIVVVNDISSGDDGHGDSDKESSSDDDASSIGSQRSNSNWKRRSNESGTVIVVSESPPPPRYAIRTNYVTVSEFLYDPSQKGTFKSEDKDNDVIELSDDETPLNQDTRLGKEVERFYQEIEVIDIDSEPEDNNRSVNNNNIVNLSKHEILELLPNLKNGSLNVIKVPPSHLLPPNVKPSRKQYMLVFTTSDVQGDDNRNQGSNNFRSNHSNAPNYSNRQAPSYQQTQDQPNTRRRHYPQNDGSFDRTYKRSTFYYNQVRPRFANNLNQQPWAPQWQMNSLQNQVSQIRDMATGMLQVASSLLSLPFVQQTLPNIQALLGIGQSFQRAPARMPLLYNSNFQYQQNHVNSNVQEQQLYAPRYNNFANYNYRNEPNNMLTYNSSVRQQFNSAPNYNNCCNNNNNSGNYNYSNSNFQRQFYNANNNLQTHNEQNSNQSHYNSPNFTQRDSNNMQNPQQWQHNISRTNVNRDPRQNSQNNFNRRNAPDVSIGSEDGDNNLANELSVNQGDRRNNRSSDHLSDNNDRENFSEDSRRSNARDRRRRKRRYFVDKLPEYSVFSDDIEVSDAALAIDTSTNNDDYIPFGDESNRNSSVSDNLNHNDSNSSLIDINGTNYVVIDDISKNDIDNNRRFDNRNRGFHNNGKNRRMKPFVRRGKAYPFWKSYNNAGNKGQRLGDNSRNIHHESRNIHDGPRNYQCNSRPELERTVNSTNESANDGIEIIEDVIGNESVNNSMINEMNKKKRKRRRLRKPNGKCKRMRLMLNNSNNINKPIEVIDIDLVEPITIVKSENTDSQRPSNVKTELSQSNRSTNKDIAATTTNTSTVTSTSSVITSTTCTTGIPLVKRESLEDEASVNSVFSNSCFSTNSTNSSSIVKSEPNASNVKKESTVIKQETGSIAFTSVSSMTTSAIETTVMTMTTATVISVKLEDTVIKNEKSQQSDKDASATQVPDKVTEESVNVKVEKSSDVIQTPLKQEKDNFQVDKSAPVVVKAEKNIAEEILPNSRVNENIVATEQVVSDVEMSMSPHRSVMESAKVLPVPSTSSENVSSSQSKRPNENVEGEYLSWAELKQKSTATGVQQVEETQISVEQFENHEEESEEEDENEDGDQVEPILRPENCKSMTSILSSLQIIGSADLSHTAERKLKISYDVYIPNVPLKKSSRSLPNYRLVVMSFRDDVPSPGEMAELTSRFEDGVPILIAVVSPDSVSFFAVATVNIPTDNGS